MEDNIKKNKLTEMTNENKLNQINKLDNSNKKNENDKIEETVFWTKDPYKLFTKTNFLDIYPNEKMKLHEKLNALTRLTIYLTFALLLLIKNYFILINGIVIIFILIFVYYVLDKKCIKNNKEKFSNIDLYQKYKHNYTNPTNFNPLMNVSLTEIEDNPHRLRAAPSFNTAVNEEINEKTKNFIQNNFKEGDVKDKLFNDLGDKLQFEQSMRQFYTTSNSTIPNNQKHFAEFCYGNMASCKDGDVKECLKNNYRHQYI